MAEQDISDLVEKVGDLTSATTELLGEVNVSKTKLDNAEKNSTAAATRAETAASTSTTKASEATAAKNAAEQARDQAVQIVHNDEGSLTPKPGAYALADEKGHMDIGWTPHLAALYPYSGVMGSIEKEDLLNFYSGQGTMPANTIEFRNKGNNFNINGRFVVVPSWTRIVLQDAESTPERATAFDDIFLDWTGSVISYRSVTPHRTITGYDRDAIASEHGYNKVRKGLYKKADNYSLLLFRVVRRNKGGYHPLLNPEGASTFISKSGSGWQGTYWYKENIREPQSTNDCFDLPTGSYPYAENDGYVRFNGNVGSDLTFTGNPDQKYYDAIYANDATPLYYSAEKVQDRQALLFDSFNRAVAGETFSGAEGTTFDIERVTRPYTSQFNTYGTGVSSDSGTLKYNNAGKYAYFRLDDPRKNVSFLKTISISCEVSGYSTGQVDAIIRWDAVDGKTKITRTLINMNKNGSFFGSQNVPDDALKIDIIYFEAKDNTATTLNISNVSIKYNQSSYSARTQFLAIDMIGSVDEMPDEWKTNGIPGNWLDVGEEGESLIPDGTEKYYKLSRKCLECYLVLFSRDNGATWSDITNTGDGEPWKSNCESKVNGRVAALSDGVRMIFYRTSANPFEGINSDKVFAVSNPKQLTYHGNKLGSLFVSNMISKVPTGSGSLGYQLDSAWDSQFVRSDHLTFDVKGQNHRPFTEIGDTDTPRIKSFSYIRRDGSMGVYYKEVKSKQNLLGDDNKFNVVDYHSTVTDNNGEKVIVGQKRVELPYQFDGTTY